MRAPVCTILKNFANFTFWGELEVVIIGDTFSVGFATSIALEGSTFVDHIRPHSSTLMATMNPLKIIGSLLSNFAPIIEIIKMEKIMSMSYAKRKESVDFLLGK